MNRLPPHAWAMTRSGGYTPKNIKTLCITICSVHARRMGLVHETYELTMLYRENIIQRAINPIGVASHIETLKVAIRLPANASGQDSTSCFYHAVVAMRHRAGSCLMPLTNKLSYQQDDFQIPNFLWTWSDLNQSLGW